MNTPLKSAAKVYAGFTLRPSMEKLDSGGFTVLQARNILSDGSIDEKTVVRIAPQNFRTNAFALKGDVLLTARGSIRAAVCKKDYTNTLAASSLYIIRPDATRLLPDYLALYLNSPVGQQLMQQELVGSTIKTLLRRSAEALPIPLPKVEEQRKIVDEAQLFMRYASLLDRKRQLCLNLANGITTSFFHAQS